MEWSMEFLAEKDLLVVRSDGTYDPNGANPLVQEVGRKCLQHNPHAILFDRRESPLAFDTLSIYERPLLLEQAGINRRHKIAIAVGDITPDERFLETVCRNSGYEVMVFDDFEAARRWTEA